MKMSASGLLDEFSMVTLLVALPAELMARLIVDFFFRLLMLLYKLSLHLRTFSFKMGASGLLDEFSMVTLLVALPAELMARQLKVFLFKLLSICYKLYSSCCRFI